MNLLLINPPYREVYSKVSFAAGVNPPIGLAYITSYLRENKINVKLLDAEALEIPISKITPYLKGYDIIGVSSMTPSLNNALKIFKIAKKLNPKCITILGGPHVTAIPVETLKTYPFIDIGVLGEGEHTALELIKALEKKSSLAKIKGIVYRNKNKIKLNPRRELIKDLDSLPFPAYDQLPMHKYRAPAHHVSFGKNIPLAPLFMLFSARGCPYNCNYCDSKIMTGRVVRYRSIENTINELKLLKEKYNVRCIDWGDENFIIDKKRAHALLDAMLKEKLNIHFCCLTRVDSVDKEILIKMKKAGCFLIRFGVESGDQRILNAMNKGITLQQIKKAFKLINEVGIPSSASFILGYPGETKQTALNTIKLAKEIKPFLAHFFIAIPIVGTKIYEIAKQKNLITDSNWQHWVQMSQDPVIRTESLTTKQLIRLRTKAYKQFYLRPDYIIKILSNIRTAEQAKFYIKGLTSVVSMIRS